VLRTVLVGTNVPVPDEDHIPPLAIVTDPLRFTVALLAQTVWLGPALDVGAGVIVNCMTSVIGLQPPLFAVVSVRVTTPASISAWLGMYVVTSEFGLGAKVPVPLDVQIPALVVETPFRFIVALFAHTTWSLPAFTASVLTYTSCMVAVTGLHPPLLVDVSVSVTLPAVVSAVDGM
jgi:hypothetical protein